MHERLEESDGDASASLVQLRELVSRQRLLIALGALAGLACGVLWVACKAPVYRASATLLLEREGTAGGILGDLAAITSAPAAVSEMEILRSRTLAREVVAPGELPDPVPAGPAERRRLGLTTLVSEDALRPLPHFLGRFLGAEGTAGPRPRLRARYHAAPTVPRAPDLRVRFLAPDRARIAACGPLSPLCGGGTPLEVRFRPGEALDLGAAGRDEYAGLRLELFPEGELTGRTYTIRAFSPEDAVEYVMRRTRVAETERNSGVMRLSFDDADPDRAAEIASALCLNYLDRNLAQGERRASKTVEFIDQQLEEQATALDSAEREVVRLQEESPRAVDVGESARTLIEELAGLELEEVQLRLARAGLEQAAELLVSGSPEALSRLGPELVDPITQSYVEQIARLSGEADLLERQDGGPYKTLVQERALGVAGLAEEALVQLGTLRTAAEALERGETAALGGLANASEAGKQDPLLGAYIAEWAKLDGELRELRKEFTEEYPDVLKRSERATEVLARIGEMLAGRIASLELRAEELGRLEGEYAGRLGEYPGGERARLESALERLRARTTTHIASRLAGVCARQEALRAELRTVEERLVQLPEEQRILADPLRRLESHTEIVRFLLARKKEAEITRAATVASAEFIDRPMPPRERRGPSVPMHAAAGLCLGLCAALGLSFLREALDRKVVSVAELEEASGLSVFGSIPDFRHGRTRVRGARQDFVAMRDDPEGAVAEAYRSLRSNLKFALGSEVRVLAFTSCTSGEGKSTTNIDVGLAFALAERRVLLVDADMRCSAVSRYLGLAASPGLSDVLSGGKAWRACLQESASPNLHVLPAGRQPRSAGDLLASAALADLIRDVRAEYDLVILDVPPVLEVADVDCLAARLDAVLLLCRSGKLSARVVEQAVRRLRHGGANLIGAALNAVRPSRDQKKYGYGYGYGEHAA